MRNITQIFVALSEKLNFTMYKPTEKGRLFPLITTGTLKVFHFPASLFDLITTSFHER